MSRWANVTALAAFPLAIVALAVALPLAREYAALRRERGLGRLQAAATVAAVGPALGLSLAVTQPLAETPVLHWVAAVALTLVLYSALAAAVRPARAAQARPARPRRR